MFDQIQQNRKLRATAQGNWPLCFPRIRYVQNSITIYASKARVKRSAFKTKSNTAYKN